MRITSYQETTDESYDFSLQIPEDADYYELVSDRWMWQLQESDSG
ncbi:MAG: hypothetical protein ACLTRS_09930 [Lachnospiraceae bacterium]